ncbi:MAG: hypothetical protein FIA96_00310 [Betaproteobacteria bacterium]|nr:hypothetical protein [Betaproteobacteria bacterium]
MEPNRLRPLRSLIFLAFFLAAAAASAASLQELIDLTPAGGTLKLAPGSYAGPVRVNKSLTVDGGGKAAIVGSGRGTGAAAERLPCLHRCRTHGNDAH